MSDQWGWAGVLAVLGAIVGSFVAALVVRWTEDRSVMYGRSACDACGRTLRPIELVPLLSGLMQRGRCRGCGARIDPIHWQVEAAAAAIGGSAGWVGAGWVGAGWVGAGSIAVAIGGAVFGWLLLALAALDWRAFWLPDRLTGLLAVAGLAMGLWDEVPPPLTDRLVGGAAGFAILWGIAAAYRRWRGREGMGGGDPKLFGAIGLSLGWRMLPAVMVTAGLIGLGIVLFRRLTGRAMAADDALPLGTLLALAAYPAWLMMIGWAP